MLVLFILIRMMTRVGGVSHDFSKKRGCSGSGVMGRRGSNVRMVLLDNTRPLSELTPAIM